MGQPDRETLHKYIDEADDDMIRLIHALVEADRANKYQEFEKKLVDQGLKSIEEGRTLTHEQVMKNTKLKFPHLFK